MHVNLISSEDTGETDMIFVQSDNKELGWVMKQMTLLKNF